MHHRGDHVAAGLWAGGGDRNARPVGDGLSVGGDCLRRYGALRLRPSGTVAVDSTASTDRLNRHGAMAVESIRRGDLGRGPRAQLTLWIPRRPNETPRAATRSRKGLSADRFAEPRRGRTVRQETEGSQEQRRPGPATSGRGLVQDRRGQDRLHNVSRQIQYNEDGPRRARPSLARRWQLFARHRLGPASQRRADVRPAGNQARLGRAELPTAANHQVPRKQRQLLRGKNSSMRAAQPGPIGLCRASPDVVAAPKPVRADRVARKLQARRCPAGSILTGWERGLPGRGHRHRCCSTRIAVDAG